MPHREDGPDADPAVNDPDIVAEVSGVFADYEAALQVGDVDAMTAAFWDSELTVRFGISECLYGAGSIAAWRRSSPPIPAGRRLRNTVIATFGTDVACVSTEFSYSEQPGLGRQSQTWIRRADGWKIVTAHVSVIGTDAG